MVHSDRKEFWLIVVEIFHLEAALHQLHLAVESDGTCASSLIRCNIVSATLGLRFKFDIQERKSKFLVWNSKALAELVLYKQLNCHKLFIVESILGISEGKVRLWFG